MLESHDVKERGGGGQVQLASDMFCCLLLLYSHSGGVWIVIDFISLFWGD